MTSYENPLGFTKEAGSLLTGLGCTNLSEFKKRNIGLDDLKYLTDEDLVLLGVGDKFDYKSFHKLSDNLKKKYGTNNQPEAADVLKMLGVVQRQLKVIHIYCKCIEKLSPSITDYFIEKDENLKASEALLNATNCILDQINHLDKALDNFQLDKKSKSLAGNNKKSYMKTSILLGGLGVGIIITIAYFYH